MAKYAQLNRLNASTLIRLVSAFLMIVSFQNIGNCQNVNFDWAVGFGGSGTDYGDDVKTDADGNVYVFGYYRGTVDFDPGAGTAVLTSNGNADIYVSKFDSLGNHIWSISMGGSSNDFSSEMQLDANANIYITGGFQGTSDFDPTLGTFNVTSAGSNDIYLAKYDSSGAFIWVETMGATGNDRTTSIDLDTSGDPYIGGFFEGAVDFDPGAGTNLLTSNGDQDVFLAKFDSNGNQLWATSFGGTGDDGAYSIDLNTSGEIHVAGYFETTVDFNPGAGTANIVSTGSKDIFYAKYANNGTYIWANAIAGTDGSLGADVVADDLGNTFIGGKFFNTIDMDPSAGTANISATGSHDIFVAKYNPAGAYTWAFPVGGSGFDHCNNIALDNSGNVYITGYFSTAADFNPGAGTNVLTAVSNSDIFVGKYSTNGDYAWAVSMGGTNYEAGLGLAVDDDNDVYVSGYYGATVDFDPGAGTNYSTSNGSYDVYTVKLGATVCTPNTGTDVISACDSYTWIDGITYTSSNNSATFTLINAAGCDSIVTLDLTINSSTSSVDVISACASYTWIDGMTYTSSNNTATHTLTNGAGCDSIITLNLTINSSNTGVDVISTCGSYMWIDGITYTSSNNTATYTLSNAAGCDSVVTLNLTIGNPNTGTDLISACDSYTWIDGTTYTSSNNTATHILTNAAGCDSVVTLDLTINYSSTGTDLISACDSYTWIDGTTYTSSNNTTTHTLTNAAGCDSVVTLDLTINYSSTGTDLISACDSYTWIDGTTYTSSNNTATHILTNAAGCDSVVTLDLIINYSNTGTDLISACDSYTWIDGTIYTSSNNTATHTLTNAAGCDSVVTLDLTINYSSTGTDVVSACDSYTWIDGMTYTSSNNTAMHTLTNAAGCDSVVTLDLTINYSSTGTDVVSACDSYTWIDGMTYTSSNNTAMHTLTNAAGCDSVVTLDLTINSVSDITTSVSGVTISANNVNATYVWLDCDNNYAIIPNETTQSFTPSTNGNYAVQLTENSCVDTSLCAEIAVGLAENAFGTAISLYPNPTNGDFIIDLGANYKNSQIHIIDLKGNIMREERFNQGQVLNVSLDAPQGIYFIEIKVGEERVIRMIVKD